MITSHRLVKSIQNIHCLAFCGITMNTTIIIYCMKKLDILALNNPKVQ